MSTRFHLYPCRDCKVVPPQGPETLQGQQYRQCLETKPTKMREILNTQHSLKQPRCYYKLNYLILLSNQNHGLINTSSIQVKWRSKEHPSVTSPLQGIVTQDSAPNDSLVFDMIWVHPFMSPGLPLPAMLQTKQATHFLAY